VNAPEAAPQSTYVTVLAWLTILLNGFGTLIAVMQNVMINFLMPSMIANAPKAPAEAFPLAAVRVMFFGLLCFAGFMTYVGYALLKRRNWARRTVIVVCALGVVWTLLCIIMFAFGIGLGRFPPTPPAGAPPGMDSAFKLMLVMTSIFSLAMALVLGWIIKRLRSSAVRAEFGRVDVGA